MAHSFSLVWVWTALVRKLAFSCVWSQLEFVLRVSEKRLHLPQVTQSLLEVQRPHVNLCILHQQAFTSVLWLERHLMKYYTLVWLNLFHHPEKELIFKLIFTKWLKRITHLFPQEVSQREWMVWLHLETSLTFQTQLVWIGLGTSEEFIWSFPPWGTSISISRVH